MRQRGFTQGECETVGFMQGRCEAERVLGRVDVRLRGF